MKKVKYYILAVLWFISILTIIVPSVYYVWTGKGYVNVLDSIVKKYYPEKKIDHSKRNFFSTWFPITYLGS